MSEKREQRRVIKLTINPWRKRKKLKKPPKPVKRSKYAQQLFEIGAGWDE